jgi:hypothetical protein
MSRPPRETLYNAVGDGYANVRRARLFPKSLEQALSFSTAQSLRKRGFGERNLLRDWANIVGPELARFTQPLKLAATGPKGPMTLYIKASGPQALYVQHAEPQILERLALYYGRTMADRVLIVQ